MSSEPVILHVCPHCERVFDSPSVCVESGELTVPTPMVVPPRTLGKLLEDSADNATTPHNRPSGDLTP